MKILGIETSCDETSAAIIETDTHTHLVTLLSNVVSSSMALHSMTGGIIPEIAAREQIKYILPVIDESLNKANCTFEDVDAIAVTYGPGLIGSLLVGVETAKTLALVWNKPIIPVNHLYGHIYANFINKQDMPNLFPAIALIVSGGHTDIVLLESHGKLVWIAGTRDDAAGEAFDKIGRLLGLPYPAGPTIEKLAKNGNPKAFRFPRPLLHEDTLDFSFSGLKTAVLREVQKLQQDNKQIQQQQIADICFAVQDAIIDILVKKTLRAAEQYHANTILLGGGVAANTTLTQTFTDSVKKTYDLPNITILVPEKFLCTDNAAMIAAAGFFNDTIVPVSSLTANPELYFD